MTSHLSDADRAELSRIWEALRQAERIVEHLLGDDDPTGLTYSRDDDEPPAAPTREHDGFSITGRPEGGPINSPTGFASTERRARQFGRSGVSVSKASLGRVAFGMGAARLGGLAAPTLRGGAR